MIGRTASHYRILDRLGGGGMGDVYLLRGERRFRELVGDSQAS